MRLRINCARCTSPVGVLSLPELGPTLAPMLTLMLRKMGVGTTAAGSGSVAGVEDLDPQVIGNALSALCPVCLVDMGVAPSLSLSQTLHYDKIENPEAHGGNAPGAASQFSSSPGGAPPRRRRGGPYSR